MPEITRFDSQLADAIKDQKQHANSAQIGFMNGLAEQVIENGGFCDDLTFSTAFFGGIDPDMNWSGHYENNRLAVDTLPEEFKTGLKIADLIRYSVFEPFISINSPNFKNIDGIGIVMPGADSFGPAKDVGYKIERPLGDNSRNEFLGRIIFNGLSQVRTYQPYDQHEILTVQRNRGTTEVKASVEDPVIFGTAAARKHILGEHYFSPKELKAVDADLEALVEEARSYHKDLSAAKAS